MLENFYILIRMVDTSSATHLGSVYVDVSYNSKK